MAVYFFFLFALCVSAIRASRDSNQSPETEVCNCASDDSNPMCMTKETADMRRLYGIVKNQCEFDCKKAKDQSLELTGESDVLQSPCCRNCSHTPGKAVCASNGVTYDKHCAFYCEIRPVTVSGTALQLIAEQKCEDIAPNCESCQGSTDYICGTNGITYMNQCDLSCNQKVFKDLEQAHQSMCAPQSRHNSSLYMMTMTFDPSRTDFGIYPQNSGYLIQSPQWLICMVKKFLQEM